MDDDSPNDEFDQLLWKLLHNVAEKGDDVGDIVHSLLDKLERGDSVGHQELHQHLQLLLRSYRQVTLSLLGVAAKQLDVIGGMIAELESDVQGLHDHDRVKRDGLRDVRNKLQQLLFPSERRVAEYHCPRGLITDTDELQLILDQTEEFFELTCPGTWESRDSGLLCHADRARFFDNFRLTSRTILWERHVPQTLDVLLTARNCVSLRGIGELGFMEKEFQLDHQVQELVAKVRRLLDDKHRAVAEARFDDAVRIRDEHKRAYEYLNRLCLEREQTDSW